MRRLATLADAAAMPRHQQRLLSGTSDLYWRGFDAWSVTRANSPGMQIVQIPSQGSFAWRPSSHLTWVRCLQGTAWVTMAGDVRDHVLRPGESLTLRGRGLAALQALGVADAQCAINEPSHPAVWPPAEALDEQKHVPRKEDRTHAI
jgi:Protein of unknown function (DUF2917)